MGAAGWGAVFDYYPFVLGWAVIFVVVIVGGGCAVCEVAVGEAVGVFLWLILLVPGPIFTE